jgi:hypothetical protein
MINGTSVNPQPGSATFTTSTLNNDDEVSVVLTSNAPCLNNTTATSNAIEVTVNAVTQITTQPLSLTECSGLNAQFTVAASGTGTLDYQWKNGNDNVGANSATLLLTSISSTDAGNYTVDVTGTCGTVTSDVAVLTINTTPTVTLDLEFKDANDYPITTDVLCTNFGVVTLLGGSPAGGTYSGSIVNNGEINTGTAAVDTYVITYTYAENGCSATATDNVSIDVCAGVNENNAASLLVYPNPATDKLTFEWNIGNIDEVIIKDLTGRTAGITKFDKGINRNEINIAHLPQGIYIVSVKGDNFSKNVRIVKQ